MKAVSLASALRVEWGEPRAGSVGWLFLVWLGDLDGSPGWGPGLSRGNGQRGAGFLSCSCQVPDAKPDAITAAEAARAANTVLKPACRGSWAASSNARLGLAVPTWPCLSTLCLLLHCSGQGSSSS